MGTGTTASCSGVDNSGQVYDVEIGEGFGGQLYGPTERDQLPPDAIAASLGCGIDVLLSARRVGPTGKAYGLDMTEEMLTLARANATQAGVTNVEFLKGTIEAIPLPDSSIDVIISNCVINLSTDKPAVFADAFRVLTPNGHVGVSDIVAKITSAPKSGVDPGLGSPLS